MTEKCEDAEHAAQDARNRVGVKQICDRCEPRERVRRSARRARSERQRGGPGKPDPPRAPSACRRDYIPLAAGGAVFASMSNVIMKPLEPWNSNCLSPVRSASMVFGMITNPSFRGAPQ